MNFSMALIFFQGKWLAVLLLSVLAFLGRLLLLEKSSHSFLYTFLKLCHTFL